MNIELKIIILLFLISILSSCDLVHTDVTISKSDINSVYDGDTITIKCLSGFKCKKNTIKIRIKGIDTPEIKGKCRKETLLARKAKQFTVAFVKTSGEIKLSYDEYDMYDRYGRLLAYLSVDGRDLSRSLIENNLGRQYHGGKRLDWC
jgi:endonuclease YncB( thermonuclease family)